MNKQVYIISESTAVCHMPDESEIQVTIAAPNSAAKPFEVIRRRLKIQDDYRDPDFVLRKGYSKYELEFVLAFDHHRMDLTALLAAERIDLKVPSYLYADASYYKTFEVMLVNEELSQAKLAGMDHVRRSPSQPDANLLPNGPAELRFVSNAMNWTEYMAALSWFQPPTEIDLFYSHGSSVYSLAANAEDPDELISGSDDISAIDVDPVAGYIFIGTDDGLKRHALDGTGATALESWSNDVFSIRHDPSGKVYYTGYDGAEHLVARTNYDGSGTITASPLEFQSHGPLRVVVDPKSALVHVATSTYTSLYEYTLALEGEQTYPGVLNAENGFAIDSTLKKLFAATDSILYGQYVQSCGYFGTDLATILDLGVAVRIREFPPHNTLLVVREDTKQVLEYSPSGALLRELGVLPVFPTDFIGIGRGVI